MQQPMPLPASPRKTRSQWKQQLGDSNKQMTIEEASLHELMRIRYYLAALAFVIILVAALTLVGVVMNASSSSSTPDLCQIDANFC